jgi:hypothetical protein
MITTPVGISDYLHESKKDERVHQVIAFPSTIENQDQELAER